PHRPPRSSTLVPYTTLFRSVTRANGLAARIRLETQDCPRRTRAHPGAVRVLVFGGYGITYHLTHGLCAFCRARPQKAQSPCVRRSEEHTSELQSLAYLVCRL